MGKVIVFVGAFLMALSLTSNANAAAYTFDGAFTGTTTVPFTATLVVTDAAVQAGFLKFSISGTACPGPGNPCTISGDGFVSFTDSWFYTEKFSPNSAYGSLAIDLTFNPDHTLSGSFDLGGLDQDVHLMGTEGLFSGTFNADSASGICDDGIRNCALSGTFGPLPVPEPSSLSIAAVGTLLMLGLGLRRRFSGI